MRQTYAKITFRVILLSFLALILIGCGESGSPGGAGGAGATASVSLSAGAATLSADGLSSTPITAVLTDSVGQAVIQQTPVVFRTNLGTFRNGTKEYKTQTADDTGTVIVQLMTEETSGNAEVWVESNKVRQKIEVKLYDPHKIGTIALRTGSVSITADGSSQVSIIATVKDALGNSEQGATVNFKTTLGQFIVTNPLPGIINRSTTAITDVDGEASVMLVSGKVIGTATILASLDGLNTSAEVVFTADEPATITLRAAPSTIRPNGTSTLFATIQDINGNPVAGKTIVFSESINASGGTLNTLSSDTNVNGEAQVTYTAGKDPGSDILQAALASDLGMKATTTIVVDPAATVIGGITVTAGSPSLVADGKGKVKIRAVVTDSDGNPAVTKTVTFTATAGTLSSATAITNVDGIAEVTLQSTTIAGPVTVRAECDGFIADVSVEFVPGPADHILLYAFPDTVPPNGAFQTAAIVQDKYDNRIDDQRLMLQVRRVGYTAIVDSAEMTPDQAQDGVYRFDWTAAIEYGPGNLQITALVNNGVSKTVTVVIDETATIVGSITVRAGATAIEADGKSQVSIRATVLDYNGKPAQGIMVDFSTTLGTVSSAQKETDQNGFAEVLLKAGTVWGTATVTADANGFIGQVDVLFTSGVPGGVSLTALPGIVTPGGKSTVIAELTDDRGVPVAGKQLYFNIYQNATNGSLSAIQGITDTNGRVTITYTAGTTYLGTDRIRVTSASDSTKTDTVFIVVTNPTGAVGYITLTSAADTLPADGITSTTVTATVYDTAGIPMPEGTFITLNTTLGTFPGGVDPDADQVPDGPLSSQVTIQTIGATGQIVTSLIAPYSSTGIATITAVSGGVSQAIQVTIEKEVIPSAAYLSISTSKTSVKTNGTDFATITATVLDANHVPIEGITVNFQSTGGQISASGILTNVNGEAVITLKSGPDKANQTVTITARVGTLTTSIPIVLYGTEITLTPATAQLSVGLIPSKTQGIVVKVKDADGIPIYNATITITFDPGTSDATLSQTGNMTTNYAGEIPLVLTAGAATGTATVTAEGLNTDATGTYILGQTADIFEITDPAESPFSSVADGVTTVPVSVHAGGLVAGDNVVFVTSFGTWFGEASKTVVVSIDGSLNATLNLLSPQAGVATVQVYAQSDPSLVDFVQISFYNPAVKACDIIIDASRTNILPSTATSQYSLTIEANVVDIYGAPVGDAVVDFYLSNTTGGGEYLSPVSVITDATGAARTTFTSGTKSTGSDPSSAVLVTAKVATPACLPGDPIGYHEDTVAIVISGAVANVSIGYATQISSNGDNTLYLQPVSVLVADTNGNPVPGAVVSLSLKPSLYATGAWFNGPDGWVPGFYNSCYDFGTATIFPTDAFGFVNEDLNNNSIIDNGEDELNRYTVGAPEDDWPNYFHGYPLNYLVPGLNNGTLNPGQSVAGTIPYSVTTGANGVASFTLTYQKEYAIWVQDQITATAMVFGTEYITQSRKWLPYATSEKEVIRNAFPISPFNVLPCGEAVWP